MGVLTKCMEKGTGDFSKLEYLRSSTIVFFERSVQIGWRYSQIPLPGWKRWGDAQGTLFATFYSFASCVLTHTARTLAHLLPPTDPISPSHWVVGIRPGMYVVNFEGIRPLYRPSRLATFRPYDGTLCSLVFHEEVILGRSCSHQGFWGSL